MNLAGIILSKIGQVEKGKHHMVKGNIVNIVLSLYKRQMIIRISGLITIVKTRNVESLHYISENNVILYTD